MPVLPRRMFEARWRTAARVLTWRATGVFWAIVVTWALTGDWMLGAEIGVLYNLIRLCTHYIYERVWLMYIPWGVEPR